MLRIFRGTLKTCRFPKSRHIRPKEGKMAELQNYRAPIEHHPLFGVDFHWNEAFGTLSDDGNNPLTQVEGVADLVAYARATYIASRPGYVCGAEFIRDKHVISRWLEGGMTLQELRRVEHIADRIRQGGASEANERTAAERIVRRIVAQRASCKESRDAKSLAAFAARE